jgi:hypothetical protein
MWTCTFSSLFSHSFLSCIVSMQIYSNTLRSFFGTFSIELFYLQLKFSLCYILKYPLYLLLIIVSIWRLTIIMSSFTSLCIVYKILKLFCGTGGQTQGLLLARQVLYSFSYSPAPILWKCLWWLIWNLLLSVKLIVGALSQEAAIVCSFPCRWVTLWYFLSCLVILHWKLGILDGINWGRWTHKFQGLVTSLISELARQFSWSLFHQPCETFPSKRVSIFLDRDLDHRNSDL